MTRVEMLPLIMFGVLMLLLLTGIPVAFVLAGTAIFFGLLGHALDVFYLSDFGFVPNRIWGVGENFILAAVPLFVFMGLMLERSGIAEELLEGVSRLFRRRRGALAYAVVLVGGILAASTGIVGATVITMGVLSLPTMLKHGYKPELACGTIAAAGTLGQIVPPSIVLVLLGDIMNIDVGDLFLACVLPGLLLMVFYSLYVFARSRWTPDWVGGEEEITAPEPGELLAVVKILSIPVALVVLVLGSILAGVASPTEAAGCGAFAAVGVAVIKRRFSRDVLEQVMLRTMRITAMVFTLLIGAQFFGVVFRGLAGDELVVQLVEGLALSPAWVLFGLMVLVFALGFFLDFMEICFIVIPTILPVITSLGFDPVWIAVLLAVNLQTSFLTPPFGFALFYLKGVTPEGITTGHIYRGVIPFVAIQLVALAVLAAFPGFILR